MIGRDRRKVWESLGDLSKLQSMEGFIDLLDRLCPIFRPFVGKKNHLSQKPLTMISRSILRSCLKIIVNNLSSFITISFRCRSHKERSRRKA